MPDLGGVDDARQPGKGQVTAQNAVRAAAGQGGEELLRAGHPMTVAQQGVTLIPALPWMAMCGIVGYVGQRPACGIVVDALRRMEYRGYDSAGVALLDGHGGLTVRRKAGRLANLEAALAEADAAVSSAAPGSGHTRWATHGRPTDRNAHPHRDAAGKVAVVHNGIIENFATLRAELEAAGVEFASDTDTEVAVHLVAPGVRTTAPTAGDFAGLGASRCCARLEGTSPWSSRTPTTRARSSPPAGPRRWWSASATARCSSARDVAAFIEHTREAVELGQDQAVVDHRRRLRDHAISMATTTSDYRVFHVDWDISAAEKGGYEYFMLKEIAEQPAAVRTPCSATSIDGRIVLDEQRLSDQELRDVDKVFVVACGTAYHSGLLAKYAIEHWTRLPVEVELASEFRYRDPVLDRDTLVVAITQSGETADTLEAVRHAKTQKARVLAICNTNGIADPPGIRRGALHPRRTGDRGGVDQDVPGPDHRQLPGRAGAGAGPRHQVPRRGRP